MQTRVRGISSHFHDGVQMQGLFQYLLQKLKILCSISPIVYGIVLLKSHIQWQYNVLLVNEQSSPSINNTLLCQFHLSEIKKETPICI